MKTFFLSLLIVLTFLGCNQPNAKKEEKSVSFENTKWELVSFGVNRMRVPENAWISFKDSRYTGNAGCNGIGGEYVKTVNHLELKAGMSTMMACPDIALESMFNKLMGKVNRYEIKGDTLFLLQDKNSVLVFKN